MSQRPRRIAVVTMTRAEYGLLQCLLHTLQNDARAHLQLIVGGAHLSAAHGMTIDQIKADGFRIDATVDMQLGDDSPVGVTRALGRATLGFADAFAALQPDLLVLLGDRYELLAAAQAAMLARIPICHVHGGELTQGAIDDAVRHAISKMAHLHCVAAEPFKRRLLQMGEQAERVFVCGAPGLDNIARLPLLDRASLEASLDFALGERAFLVTYHPVTLLGEPPEQAFAQMMDALLSFIDAQLIVTGVNADAGGQAIRELAKSYAARYPQRILLVESLGPLRYLSAMRQVDVVIGNSSSGLLEAPAMGVPSVNIGPRQHGRPCAPSVINCEASQAAIRAAIVQAMSAEQGRIAARRQTPYGEAGASARIAHILCSTPLENILLKQFQDFDATE